MCKSIIVTAFLAALTFAAAGTLAFAQSGNVTGAVHDPSGAPVAGALVRASGPTTATTQTDSAGAFSLTVPPGVYQISVSKSGYQSAVLQSVAIVQGAVETLAVALQPATLSSLKVIGSVVSRAGAFNTSPASSNIISSQTFVRQAQPQVMAILNQTPGVVASFPGGSANGAVPGAITFPNIRGALSFETATLIDGHPVSVGQYGDYVTTFLNSFVLDSVEVIKGPGAAAPETNYAIGGTINFRTKDPTYKPTGNLILGGDNFGGEIVNAGYSGTTTNGKLGWVLDYALYKTNGPLNNYPGWFVPNGGTINGNFIGFQDWSNSAPYKNQNVYGPSIPFNSSPIVACCQTIPSTYQNEMELIKARYKFSPVTVGTFSFLGGQTTANQTANNSQITYYDFDPTVPGVSNGAPPIAPPAPYTGPLKTGTVALQAPFFPGTDIEYNNEPIFEAEIRSAIANDSIVARAYSANINRLIYQGGDNPSVPITENLGLFGTVYSTDNNGNAVPVQTYNGQVVPVQFNAYFHEFEVDALRGYSLEYDHPFAQNDLLTFAYDHTNSTSYAGVQEFDFSNCATANCLGLSINVPQGSAQNFGTFLLRGLLYFGSKFNVTLANYVNTYQSTYATGCNNPPSNTCPSFTLPTAPNYIFTTTSSSHYDGRVGLVYRPSADVATRFSFGSAIAPPYLGILSNITLPINPYFGGPNATQQVSGGNLAPETAFGYDLGADVRSKSGVDTFSGDLYLTNLYDQFITQSRLVGSCVPQGGGSTTCVPGTGPGAIPVYGLSPVNLSNARYQGIELSFRHAPPTGFGFLAQGALQQAYPYNLNPCFYYSTPPCNSSGTPNQNLAVLPNQNFYGGVGSGGNGVSNQSIPYAQAYAELNYRMRSGVTASFGETLYGNNNSLNVPAFWIANANLSLPIGDPQTSLQFSFANLFNQQSGLFITTAGGVRIPLANGQAGLTNANVLGPQRFTLMFVKDFGSR